MVQPGLRIIIVTLLAILLAATLPAAPSGAQNETIQPGQRIGIGDHGCTLSWILDGADGNTYATTAGHCTDRVGQSASIPGLGVFATVVFREYDPDESLQDLALLQVHAGKTNLVDASVMGHPNTPTGVANRGETAIGDEIRFSGWGQVFSTTQTTREGRSGVLLTHSSDEYRTAGTTIFGDSGGPAIHAPTGQAIGIVNGIYLSPWAGQSYGLTVEGILDRLADEGFALSLRTA